VSDVDIPNGFNGFANLEAQAVLLGTIRFYGIWSDERGFQRLANCRSELTNGLT
jgi:hypothetical protein